MNKIVDLYCDVDAFCKVFVPQMQKKLLGYHGKTTDEIMTIVGVLRYRNATILKTTTATYFYYTEKGLRKLLIYTHHYSIDKSTFTDCHSVNINAAIASKLLIIS
jgi:hypothetical protein